MSSPHHHALELDDREMRTLVETALSYVLPHLQSLPSQPAAVTRGGPELARASAEPLPHTGESAEKLMARIVEDLAPQSFNTAGPGYLAYIPGGGLFQSAVANLVASAVNRYVGVFAAAPGLVQIEVDVIRWLCEIVGFPEDALGILTSGGSLANFSAVVTARSRHLPENFLSGTVYLSDQTHHSVEKAVRLAGFPGRSLRVIPTDSAMRIRLDLLEQAITEDRGQGLEPFLLVGNAGTTNTGAVDSLDALAGIAQRENLWFHVDAAYGGFFAMTDRGRVILKGLELADSIVLDPHKGLFIPYGTGALLVRDVEALRAAHSVGAEYLPPMQDKPDLVDFCEISPELSRPFRGLSVWLPLKMHGVQVFRDALDEKLDLARWATDRLSEVDDVEIVARPDLSLLAFRWQPPHGNEELEKRIDELNREWLDRINAKGRVYLTGTELSGRFVLRICVLSFRTHRDRMEAAMQDIRAALDEMKSLHLP